MVDRPEQPHPWRRSAAAAAIALLVVITACGTESGQPDGPTADAAAADAASEQPAPVEPELGAPGTAPTAAAPSATPTTASTTPRRAGIVVTRVVDGDTVELADGSKARLTGIDTPERGQCGFGEATVALNDTVMGREVVLVAGARDDTDRYGRILRYLEVDGVDVNLAMIRSGWAIARYDSRDGYGRHQREDAYVAADVGTPVRPECAGSTPSVGRAAPTSVAPVVPSGGGTSPRFSSCKQAKANGHGPFVRGVHPEYDWYRDGDNDGTVCE